MLPWRSLAAVSVLSCWKVSISYQLLMLAALRANWDMWERKPLGASSSSTNTLAKSRTSREMDRTLKIGHDHVGYIKMMMLAVLQENWDMWDQKPLGASSSSTNTLAQGLLEKWVEHYTDFMKKNIFWWPPTRPPTCLGEDVLIEYIIFLQRYLECTVPL